MGEGSITPDGFTVLNTSNTSLSKDDILNTESQSPIVNRFL